MPRVSDVVSGRGDRAQKESMMIYQYDKRHKRLYLPTDAEADTIGQVVDVIQNNRDSFDGFTVELAETIYDLMRYNHGWTYAQAVYMGSIIRKAGLGELEIPQATPGTLMTDLFEGIDPLGAAKNNGVIQFAGRAADA